MLDTIVIASPRRFPIITEYLSETPHHVYWSSDPDAPDIQFDPRTTALTVQMPGAYRCYVAHQEASRLGTHSVKLMLEDDARPRPETDWQQIVASAIPLLASYAVISLHSRYQHGIKDQIEHAGLLWNIMEPVEWRGQKMIWQYGALAYLLREDAAKQLQQRPWDGVPVDFVITNDLGPFIALHEMSTPFIHDRIHGSLIEGKTHEQLQGH